MAKPIRVIINNRDMLSWPKAMLEYLENVPNIIPVIIDNASTYPPLLEWYQTGPCEVLKVNQNLGHRAPWITREVFNNLERYYVVTDPDLDLSGVPTDLIDHLIEGLNLHPDKRKAGLSLEINDLPTDSPVYENAIKWETGFWNNLKTNGFYHSPVDTTFAVYDIQKELLPFIPCALRADRPYTFRHLHFYLTPSNITEEDAYYLEHASDVSTMARYLRPMVEAYRKEHPSVYP